MATVKLTDDVWNDREYEKIKGVLYQALGGANKAGCDSTELRAKLDYVGLTYYTNPELAYFKARLIDDLIIEEVGTTAIEKVAFVVTDTVIKAKANPTPWILGLIAVSQIALVVLNLIGVL